MWANTFITVNISVFILISTIFVCIKTLERKRFLEIRNNLSQILSKPVKTIIILDYRNLSYEKISNLLTSDMSLGEFIILFTGPEWLYEIKKRSWTLYQTVHTSSLSVVSLPQGYVSLIKYNENRITVIHEVAEYLFIESTLYKTNHIVSVADQI
ncbi:MAG: hypothetical protein E6Y08_22560 [Paenibacillus sp.]|uniref:hypothetical protein n=1 Tax=Paenibacillus sp. TaxID=58172 RepID=UPI00290CAC86|nr:hypothetical protein [Paenibacillus sp.]MDU4698605.1 hypothetical protein [Paenibacillus sp.]